MGYEEQAPINDNDQSINNSPSRTKTGVSKTLDNSQEFPTVSNIYKTTHESVVQEETPRITTKPKVIKLKLYLLSI